MGANCVCSHTPPDLISLSYEESTKELDVRLDIYIGSGGDDQGIGLGHFSLQASFNLVSDSTMLSLPSNLSFFRT